MAGQDKDPWLNTGPKINTESVIFAGVVAFFAVNLLGLFLVGVQGVVRWVMAGFRPR